jgi:hypothetical protein
MPPAYVVEWLENEQVLCYRFYEITPAMMDEWMNHVTEVVRAWAGYKPLHALIDLRGQPIIVSVQVFSRMRKAASIRPELKGRTAILIDNPRTAKLASSLLLRFPLGVRQRNIFTDEAQALRWLVETPVKR